VELAGTDSLTFKFFVIGVLDLDSEEGAVSFKVRKLLKLFSYDYKYLKTILIAKKLIFCVLSANFPRQADWVFYTTEVRHELRQKASLFCHEGLADMRKISPGGSDAVQRGIPMAHEYSGGGGAMFPDGRSYYAEQLV
jgi:hypothetical protein